MTRLERLLAQGPGPKDFALRQAFPPPDARAGTTVDFGGTCRAT